MTNEEFVIASMRTESSVIQNPINPRLLHAAFGLQTEAGELTDALKKHIFYGKELDVTNILEESGDLMWYLAILFDELGTSFTEEQKRVIAKLKVRFPEKFTNELAETRDLATERKVLEGETCEHCANGNCDASNPLASEDCPAYIPF